MKVGERRPLPPTEDGLERLEELSAIAVCPTCGKDVELYAETAGWTEDDAGVMRADSFGPAMGECCDNFIADWWEGTFCFRRPA